MIVKLFEFSLCVFLVSLLLLPPFEIDASPSFPEQFISGRTAAYFPDGYHEDDSDALNLEGAFYKSDGKSLDLLNLNGLMTLMDPYRIRI